MYKKFALALLLAAAASVAPSFALAASPPANAQQMAPLQYLIGTWHCNWQSGTHSGSEDQVFVSALDGAWLEEREIVSKDGAQLVRSIHYTGYDPKLKQYVHVGPDANGSYEIAKSPDASAWSSTDGDFIHKKVSDSKRTMTQMSGNTAVASMTCTKAGE